MISKVISGRRLDRHPRWWLKWTKKNGPVAIHERDGRSYVLLSFDDYTRLRDEYERSEAERSNKAQPKSP